MPLSGHNLTLTWHDFPARVPAGRDPSDLALTSANYTLRYRSKSDGASGTRRAYRVGNINVRVILERDKMWAVRDGRTPALLRHEQGHYDIVALLARDLYQDLKAWNSAKPPKRFATTAELTSAVDELAEVTGSLVEGLTGSGESTGLYDQETDHGRNAEAQGRWNRALAAARANRTRLVDALRAQGIQVP